MVVSEPIWLKKYRERNSSIFNEKPIKKSKYFRVVDVDNLLIVKDDKYNVIYDDLKRFKIEVMSWEKALIKIPGRIKEILENELPSKNQYESFINANFNSGNIIIISKNSNIEGLKKIHVKNTKNVIIKNIIIIEKGIKNVKILESIEGDVKFFNETLFLDDDSESTFVKLYLLKDFGICNNQNIINKDSKLVLCNAYFNGNKVFSKVVNNLQKPGSSIEEFDLSLLNDKQFLNIDLMHLHNSPNANSHSIFKSILKENSKNVFNGMIKIMPHAQKSNALLQAHSLLLSKSASSINIPSLEIEADDVKATHSATVFNIDEDKLFYLENRGLSEEESKDMIIRGFLEDMVDKLPSLYNQYLVNLLDSKISEKQKVL